MKFRKIHYAGSVHTPRRDIPAGWAACCKGGKAVRIRREGAHTPSLAKVTCRACLRVMEKDKGLAARLVRLRGGE